MAIVLTAFATAFTRVPFLKPPDSIRQFTAIPRATVAFITNAGVLPLKPINDQQKIQFAPILPTTFAYRLISAGVNVQLGASDDWNQQGELQITNAMRGQELGLTTRHTMDSNNGSTFSTITGNLNYFFPPMQMPTFVLQSLRQNVAAALDFRFGNDAAAASAAGVVNFFCFLYEYDIEQVQAYPPLIPQLTYAIA